MNKPLEKRLSKVSEDLYLLHKKLVSITEQAIKDNPIKAANFRKARVVCGGVEIITSLVIDEDGDSFVHYTNEDKEYGVLFIDELTNDELINVATELIDTPEEYFLK
jgi:hypothetical protein